MEKWLEIRKRWKAIEKLIIPDGWKLIFNKNYFKALKGFVNTNVISKYRSLGAFLLYGGLSCTDWEWLVSFFCVTSL